MEEVEKKIENLTIKKVEKCSRCGANHFDLSCIYFKVNQSSDNIKN